MTQNKIKVEAVLFDKDGTLVDFDSFWVSLSRIAVEELLERWGQKDLTEEILVSLGIQEERADRDGVLCKGNYRQMAQASWEILRKAAPPCSFEKWERSLTEAYIRNAPRGTVRPLCENLHKILSSLSERGVKTALVTTDNDAITRLCLERLGIGGIFSRIYTADSPFPLKPKPDAALDFCRREHCRREGVWMVGDTETDLLFAKAAGIRFIGIAADGKTYKRFEKEADAVIENPSELSDLFFDLA